MKKLLSMVLCACCSVACVATPDDGQPSQAPVEKGPNDPQPNAPPQPNTPPEEQPPPGDDPSDQEGATCNDPPAVTPEGWTPVDLGAFDIALPPGAKKVSAPGPDHLWYVMGPDGKPVGHVTAGVVEGVSSLDEAEAREKTFFTIGDDGSTVPSPLSFARATHECREDLVTTGTPAGNAVEWHHVMVGADVVTFGCSLPADYAGVCADFVASFHVE